MTAYSEHSGPEAMGMCPHGNFPDTCRTCHPQTAVENELPELTLKERVEQARRRVEQAVLLDAYLDTEGDHTLEGFLEAYRLSSENVSPHLQERFASVMREWDEVSRGHASVRATLEGIVEKRFGATDATHAGAVFFEGATRKNLEEDPVAPIGNVELSIKGPFIIAYFSEDEDYARLQKKNKNSGGTFHRAGHVTLTYNEADIRPAVLMVNGSSESFGAQQIVDHERQHFINDRWMIRETTGTTTGEDRMKDEILAYLKDGSDPDRIQILQSSELYTHIPAGLDEEKKKDLYQNLQRIIDALRSAEILFSTNTARTLLVYHLIDIPFPKMADAIQTLTLYEQQNGNPARAFSVPGQAKRDLVPPPDDDEQIM